MNWLLKITDGPMKGAEIALVAGRRVKVGRSDACDIIVGDQALGEVAFEMDVSENAVTLLLPDGTNTAMKPFVAHSFGFSAFVVGPSDGEWKEIVPAKDDAEVSETEPEKETAPEVESVSEESAKVDVDETKTEERKKSGGCFVWVILGVILLLVLAFLVWWFWPVLKAQVEKFTDGNDSRMIVETRSVVGGKNLSELAKEHGLELVKDDEGGTPLLKGNLRLRTERMAVRALALAADPACRFDLTDDETLGSSASELLFVVTEGAIKVVSASNRIVTLSGYAPDTASLEKAVRALDADVPGIEKLDTGMISLGGLPPKEIANTAFVRGDVATVQAAKNAAAKENKHQLPIAGILTVPYPCVVMANGARILEGAPIGTAEIVKIEADRIVLREAGHEFEWRP